MKQPEKKQMKNQANLRKDISKERRRRVERHRRRHDGRTWGSLI